MKSEQKTFADSEEQLKTDAAKPVSLKQLFRYASGGDVAMMLAGSLLAAAHGCGWPLISIIFGQMTNDFIRQGTGNVSAAASAVQMPLPWGNASDFDFTENMNRYAIQYAIIGVAVLFVSCGQLAFWAIACERQVHRLRLCFFRSLLQQDMQWQDAQASGALTTRLADDLDKVRDGIGDKTSLLAQAAAGFITGFTVGFVKSWKMTLVMMSLTPLLAIGGALIGRFLSSMTSREQKAYAAAGAVAEETVSCIRTVAALGAEDEEEERYQQQLQLSMRQGIIKSIIQGFGMGSVMLVLFSAYCLAFWYGATQVKDWQLSGGVEGLAPGDIFTVFFCVMIGSFSLGTAGQPFAQLVAAQGAAGAVHEIIDRQPEIVADSDSGQQPADCSGSIEFRDVHFAYPSRPDSPVLRGVSFRIRPGQTVALTGPSGCGKSSIVKLLQRFYDPQQGSVLLDGFDLRDLNLRWCRLRMGVVSQEPVLFACSVSDNVRLGREEATDAEVVEACRLANAHSFICNLPDGYNTEVGERGAQLSGGQKQRVAIARAVIRRPAILLLDEATSALDSESEAVVQRALDNVAGTVSGVTKIVIAHRLSTVRNADLILSISEGQVVEAGSHEELMKRRGQYYELVSVQEFAEESHMVTEMRGSDPSVVGSLPRQRKASTLDGNDLEAAFRIGGKSVSNLEEVDEETQKQLLKQAPGFFTILRMNSREWPFLIVACIGSLLNGGVMPLFALFFAEVISVFAKFGDEMLREATFWALMFLAVGGVQFAGNALSSIGLGVSGERLTCRLRAMYFGCVLRQDISFFDDPRNSVGAITTRLATDAAKVQGASGIRLALPLQGLFSVSLGLCIALYYGWKLALMILGCVPVMAVAGFLHMAYQTRSQKADDQGSEMAGKTAAEAIENLATVQSLCREGTFYQRYHDYLLQPYHKRLLGTALAGFTYGFSQAAVFFVYAAAFRFGAYLVSINDMEASNVFKVFFSITFAGLMVGQIFSLIPDYAKARLAAASILQLMHQQPLIDSKSPAGEVLHDFKGELRFIDVEFAYPQRPAVSVLKKLNLTVPAGSTVAIVGASGCGKSTLVSLLQRMYDPTSGCVQLDRRDLRQLNVRWLRRQMRCVQQEPALFSRSIGDNIRCGLSDAPPSQSQLEAAARLGNAHEFVLQQLPAGYDTEVGERGAQLSGGQKQRVAIARAVVTEPRVLLLDEATSALDTESEAQVQAALDVARRGRTCVLIAHRLSTVQAADCIVVMEAGAVVECGTHSQLLALGGAYHAMVTAAGRRGTDLVVSSE